MHESKLCFVRTRLKALNQLLPFVHSQRFNLRSSVKVTTNPWVTFSPLMSRPDRRYFDLTKYWTDMPLCLIPQSLNEKSAVKKRLFQYLLPVGILAFLFNVPKFLEADIAYEAISHGKSSLTEHNEAINRSYNHIQPNQTNPLDLWNNASYLHGNESGSNNEKVRRGQSTSWMRIHDFQTWS